MASSSHELHRLGSELLRPRVQRGKAVMISLLLVATAVSLGLVLGHSRLISHRTSKAIEVVAIFFLVAMMLLRRGARRSR
jgi:fatty-acid desaturase